MLTADQRIDRYCRQNRNRRGRLTPRQERRLINKASRHGDDSPTVSAVARAREQRQVRHVLPYRSDPSWQIRHVSLFCDLCGGNDLSADIRARDRDEAYAGLRRHAAEQGWTITPGKDVCPPCTAANSPAETVGAAS